MTLILIDGRSGAGKTTFARELAERTGTRILHMDTIYRGWPGLAHGTATLERILTARAAGEIATWHEWDWYADDWGVGQQLTPDEDLIVEGCGSVTPATAALADRVVWLEAPEPLRRQRALDRDGDDSWWDIWKVQEEQHLERNYPRDLATEVIDAD